MMKKVILITIFFLTLSLGAAPVAAHILVTADNIGATLHIDPDDDPIVGQSAAFFLEFKDTENKFLLADCRCQAFINREGEELYFTALKAINDNSPLSASFQFKFPAKGSYELVIKGVPIDAGAFNEFEMRETIAVEREDGSAATLIDSKNLLSHWPKLVGILVIVIFVAVSVVMSKHQVRKQSLQDAT